MLYSGHPQSAAGPMAGFPRDTALAYARPTPRGPEDGCGAVSGGEAFLVAPAPCLGIAPPSRGWSGPSRRWEKGAFRLRSRALLPKRRLSRIGLRRALLGGQRDRPRSGSFDIPRAGRQGAGSHPCRGAARVRDGLAQGPLGGSGRQPPGAAEGSAERAPDQSPSADAMPGDCSTGSAPMQRWLQGLGATAGAGTWTRRGQRPRLRPAHEKGASRGAPLPSTVNVPRHPPAGCGWTWRHGRQ